MHGAPLDFAWRFFMHYIFFFLFLFTLILEPAFYSHCVDEGHDHSILPTTRCLHSFLLESYLIYPQIPFFHKPECEKPTLVTNVKGEKLKKNFHNGLSPLLLRKVLLSI
ncbi:hypothetical protein V8C34DRAFT_224624 [Trichoderma compactum]